VLVFLHTFVALHAWVLCRAALHGSTCYAKNQMKCSVFLKKNGDKQISILTSLRRRE
jgi:hypothetical protein